MLETTQNNTSQDNIQITKPRKVLRMIRNTRMGGSVPAWRAPETEKEKISQNLSQAISNPTKNENFQTALTLQDQNADKATNYDSQNDEFGFDDVIDMINPLHHIPLIGSVYREVTGDEIKPVGRIIGGGVFGGAIGIGSGLVSTIIEEETGQDIAGNAMRIVRPDNKPDHNKEHPIESLNTAIKQADNSYEDNELPGTALALVDLKTTNNNQNSAKKLWAHSTNSRTAGTMPNYMYNSHINSISDHANISEREPITKFSIQRMPVETN